MSCKGAQGLVRSREQNVDIMARLLPGLTAATGMDALSHVVESYGNVWNRPINEGLALDAIELGRQTWEGKHEESTDHTRDSGDRYGPTGGS